MICAAGESLWLSFIDCLIVIAVNSVFVTV